MSNRWKGGFIQAYFDPLTDGTINNELYAWGLNAYGTLGNGSTASASSPIQIGTAVWAQVAGGLDHAHAIQTNGTLWGFGRNNARQLGDGTSIDKSSPVQIGSDTDWDNVSAGYRNSIAIKTDGTMYSWGSNSRGIVGNNTRGADVSLPTPIGALTNWLESSSGQYHAIATKTDGTMWSWGYNGDGQLGVNDSIDRSSPTQIGSLTTWAQASASGGSGNQWAFAVKTDGTLWTWGDNGFGQLGTNNTIFRSSPVQVGALTTWLKASAGTYHSAAIKTDGTIWTWGSNANGALGLSTAAFIPNSSPTQVGALTNWTSIAAGFMYSIATKTDGTFWFWGDGSDGRNGLNSTIKYSSPVQVGSLTTWASVPLGNTRSVYGLIEV